MKITKAVAPAFENFIFDWDYEEYLLIGGYGSGKSYHIALKLILKLLEEKRRVLVVRQVYATIFYSCYSLFCEILSDMNLLTDNPFKWKQSKSFQRKHVLARKSPMSFQFPNSSEIIFSGVDNPEKLKSINNVSIVWLEECSEMSEDAYLELQGRIRTPNLPMHFLLSCNPVSKSNWVYKHYFRKLDDQGDEVIQVEDEDFYNKKVLIHNGTYYMHSVPDDNPWLPKRYLYRLDKLRLYDYHLYMVARWGQFGVQGTRVLPQFKVCKRGKFLDNFWAQIERLGPQNQYFGFDFGFEESYNAVISMSVDLERGILYIWDEIYRNHITDDKFAALPEMQALKKHVNSLSQYGKVIVADNEDPKAIQYYRQNGFKMRGARNKFAGSRLSNTRKVKRFEKIICHPDCVNTIRELYDLTYKKKPNGDVMYDTFNIDPHSFSAIWYALDTVTVADVKDKVYWSKKGGLDGEGGWQAWSKLV